jgi:molybdopterin molybdotransferase
VTAPSPAIKAVHLTYAEARDRVRATLRPLGSEPVPLDQALGRALREPLVAPHALPPFDNTSMDGYAVRSEDTSSASARRSVALAVVEVLPAGHIASRGLRAGEAMRIMTGAAIPPGADSVVAFEDCERVGEGAAERLRLARPVTRRENVRDAGADLAAGATALEAGRELSPHDLALAAALGGGTLVVGRRPRVAIVSTGDELLAVDAPLRPGAIRDSNVPLLRALVAEAGGTVVLAAHAPDDPRAVAAALRDALERSDVTLTIGGVSAGDFDPVKQAIGELEGVELWRVAMKPGRPQAFGVPEGRLFFGLPGNPASVACVFEALVRPALRALAGYAAVGRPRLTVRAAERIESRAGRTDFVRVTLEWRGGSWIATPAGPQISGHLTPQSRAHALLVVPEEAERLETRDEAEAWVLRLPDGTWP